MNAKLLSDCSRCLNFDSAFSKVQSVGCSSVVALAVFFTGICAEAAREVKFKEFPLEISKNDRLVISGVRGQVRLIPIGESNLKTASPMVRARKVSTDRIGETSTAFDSLSFQTRRDGTTVFVEMKGPDSRQAYLALTKLGAPELSFDIEGPSIPAEIHFHSGMVTAVGWKSSIAVTLTEGKVNLSDGEGTVRVLLTRGDLQLSRQKGDAELEIHGGKAQISNLEGDLRLHSFVVESNVQQLMGKLKYRGKAGNLNINKASGEFLFENGRGSIVANGLEGTVRGSTEDGAVNLQLSGDIDVLVETEDGSVGIKPAAGVGALLRLSSDEGVIQVPEKIRVSGGTGVKTVLGRLDGAPKGQITVRSKRGAIRIR
jgi:hypothetical protein